MTSITSVSSNFTSAGQSNNSPTLGKEDFLTLLVTQLQNQDPLNPSDPTEFTAQLAQFSSLEQLIDINANMEQQVLQTNTGLVSSVGAIGKEVVAISDTVDFSGNPMELGYYLNEDVTEVTLTVRNEDGEVVRTLYGDDLDAGKNFLSWDGKDDSGDTVEEGTYSLHVEEKSGDLVRSGVPLVRSIITGLENGISGAVFVTEAGMINWGAVVSIQDADQG